jgi:hypothetical protein
MIWLALSALILAADPPQANPRLDASVKACVAEVNKEGPDYPLFDAYASFDGSIRWLGNQQQVFKFQKCMDKRGFTFPVQDKK